MTCTETWNGKELKLFASVPGSGLGLSTTTLQLRLEQYPIVTFIMHSSDKLPREEQQIEHKQNFRSQTGKNCENSVHGIRDALEMSRLHSLAYDPGMQFWSWHERIEMLTPSKASCIGNVVYFCIFLQGTHLREKACAATSL